MFCFCLFVALFCANFKNCCVKKQKTRRSTASEILKPAYLASRTMPQLKFLLIFDVYVTRSSLRVPLLFYRIVPQPRLSDWIAASASRCTGVSIKVDGKCRLGLIYSMSVLLQLKVSCQQNE